MLTVLLVIVILVFLIVAHEFGHFLAAKLSGVKVEEFGIGYPPRALTFGKWGGTEYTLNWIPFGGFVRLYGDGIEATSAQARAQGSLLAAPRWKQAVILAAGVAMNAFVAWLLFTTAFVAGTWQAIETGLPDEPTHIVVAQVVAGSPASAAGLLPGDELTGMSDAEGDEPDALTPDGIVTYVREHAGDTLELSYIENGVERSAAITPAQGVLRDQAGQPALGVALVLVAKRSEGWLAASRDGWYETIGTFASVGESLGGILLGALHGAPDLSDVAGPVGIASYVGAAAQDGAGALLMLAAAISVNLVIINLIPIPALDGGRLLMLGIEAVRRRKTHKLTVQIVNALGIALIVFFMVAVTYHDVARLLA